MADVSGDSSPSAGSAQSQWRQCNSSDDDESVISVTINYKEEATDQRQLSLIVLAIPSIIGLTFGIIELYGEYNFL